jgi:hypothetical protein|tara:strand:+ start:23459 stop:23902 length:444 start_codon:yes stop_codon:yes gene_type:complete
MGRPINKDKIGFGTGRIKVTRHFFTGGSEATTAAHIVRQAGNNKFVVRLDSNNDGGGAFSPRTHASDEVLTLVNKANGALAAGEFKIDAVGSDSTTYQVTKLRNRTVQLEGGATEDNVIYEIGFDASAREIAGHPNASLSVALPRQS